MQTIYVYNLIFLCYMSKSEVMVFNCLKFIFKHFPKPLCEKAAQTSLIKVLFLKGVWISRFKVQNVIYSSSYYFDNINVMEEK